MRRAALLSVLVLSSLSSLMALGACNTRRAKEAVDDPTASPSTTPPPAASAAPPAMPVCPVVPMLPLAEGSDVREGSAVVLARIEGRSVALIADEDEDAIHTIDLASRKVIARTELAGRPTRMLLVPGGKLVVALRDAGAVAVMVAHGAEKPLAAVDAMLTADEPIALAITPMITPGAASDSGELWVATGWGHTLEGFVVSEPPSNKHRRLAVHALDREPRALTIPKTSPRDSPGEGARAFVGYMSEGHVGVVDLKTGAAKAFPFGTKSEVVTVAMGFSKAMPMLNPCFPDELHCGPHTAHMHMPELRTIPARVMRQTFALVRTLDPEGRGGEHVLAPHVLVGAGEATQPSAGYGGSDGGFTPAVFDVAKLDPMVDDLAKDHVTSKNVPHAMFEDCRLPRDAVVSAGTLYVACLGSGTVAGYDTRIDTPARGLTVRVAVPFPSALAADPTTKTLVVASAFERTVRIVRIEKFGLVASDPIALPHALSPVGGVGLSAAATEGRRLFHLASDRRISADGRACASCHPDAREDGLVWPTPKGPRQTIFLAGRLGREAPFGWDAQHGSIPAHISVTLTNLRGTGLGSDAIAQLTAYLREVRPPSRQARPLTETEARGRALFASEKTSCASCHIESGAFSDGVAHDVGSKTKGDSQDAFLAPSLRYVAGSAPYFHDGRYATLGELIVACDGRMGSTKHLAREDLGALEAYLRTL